jgi:hypothetical protein
MEFTIDILSLEELWLQITNETLLPKNIYSKNYSILFLTSMRKQAQLLKINPIIEL